MHIDASAITAILAEEPDGPDLARRLADWPMRQTTPLAVWEAAVAIARVRGLHPGAARAVVETWLADSAVELVPVLPDAAATALDAFARYGKGRHRAALNFGDCFAYACARLAGAPLLYKGDDFALTDIEAA